MNVRKPGLLREIDERTDSASCKTRTKWGLEGDNVDVVAMYSDNVDKEQFHKMIE